jgi:type VI secretion system protein ImpM
MAEAQEVVPGWFGKIPSLGDFASRRLPQSFIDTWDNWLQLSMTASRAALGAAWLDTYLTSPIWRFLLLPGVIGDAMWAGVIMPSVDKVGRHFPLAIAVAQAASPGSLAAVVAAREWYAELEAAALATLDIGFTVDQFEARLAALPFPQMSMPSADAGALHLVDWWREPSLRMELTLPAGYTVQHLMLGAATQLLQSMGNGKSLWWQEMEAPRSSRLRCFTALPHPENHAALLQDHGEAQSVASPVAASLADTMPLGVR